MPRARPAPGCASHSSAHRGSDLRAAPRRPPARRARCTISAPTCRISCAPSPREVSAGVPMRMPEATAGGSVSYGIAFLFTMMPQRVERVLGALAVRGPSASTSTSSRWLSVPPLTTRSPASTQHLRQRLRVLHDLAARTRGTRRSTPRGSATALPAITCISGPPCAPGNTPRSTLPRVRCVAEHHARRAARAASCACSM